MRKDLIAVIFFIITFSISAQTENFRINRTTIGKGPYLLNADDNGVLSLLYNSDFFIFRKSGLEYLYDNKIRYFGGLENRGYRYTKDSFALYGNISEPGLKFTQTYTIAGDRLKIRLEWNSEIPDELEICNFVFHLNSEVLKGGRFIADDRTKMYPENLSEMFPASGIREFHMLEDKPSLIIKSDQPFNLGDARAWGGSDFTLIFHLGELDSPLEIEMFFPDSQPETGAGTGAYELRYSLEGYTCDSPKRVFVEWPDFADRLYDRIELVNDSGRTVLSGKLSPAFSEYQFNYAWFDFSEISAPGNYFIRWAGGKSEMFPMSDSIFDDIWQDALEVYIPWQMCHAEVDLQGTGPSHGLCHNDDGVRVRPEEPEVDGFYAIDWPDTEYKPGETIECSTGGWHDAGDWDLNTAAQALTVHHLALAWEEFNITLDKAELDIETKKYTSCRPDGIPDILQQTAWGALWLLSMQQGDGRIYPGIVALHDHYLDYVPVGEATDGLGVTGDERNVYIDYQTSEHCKGVIALAAASRVLKKHYPELAADCLEAAVKGYDYYRSNPLSYHVQTSFITDSHYRKGEIQDALSIAAELYATTRNPEYLEDIKKYEKDMKNLTGTYPVPDTTNRMNYIYPAPYLARIYDLIDDQELKKSILEYLKATRERKEYLFGFDHWPWKILINQWYGQSGVPVRLVYDHYYISKVLKDEYSMTDVLPMFYWLFGMHPVDSKVYIYGLNENQPEYFFGKELVSLYGNNPDPVAGAVAPGLCLIGNVVYFQDEQYAFHCIEHIIDVSATLIFAAHALQAE